MTSLAQSIKEELAANRDARQRLAFLKWLEIQEHNKLVDAKQQARLSKWAKKYYDSARPV